MLALLFLAGLALLLLGAEMLVRGASRLALALGLTPLVVGLTVVAIGTSTPELAISVGGALAGTPDIALGNVVGSNIANVLLILGLVALITPLVVQRQLIWLDVPIMIAVSLLTLLLAWDGRITRAEGALLMAGAAAYIGFLLWLARRRPEAAPDAEELDLAPAGAPRVPRQLLLIALGLALLVIGARLLVRAAVELAAALGLSELVIGLTVVAVGTSLPEIATSVVAGLRGKRDLAVGNIVGSNIFNLLLVLGATALASPSGVAVSPAAQRFDLPAMVAVAIACLPIFFTGHRIARWEGALFLAYYAAYVAYLLLQAGQHAALADYRLVMLYGVIPLTAVTLLVLALDAWRAQRAAPAPREP